MVPRTAFNSDSERRMFTANFNWFVAKHFGTHRGSVSKAAAEAGVKLYTICDAKSGKVSVENADCLARWIGHSFESLCTQRISDEVPTLAGGSKTLTSVNPLTGQPVPSSPRPITRRPRHRNGNALKVTGLIFTLKSGKPQLFELGDVKFVIEGRTGQSVKMDINIEG